MNETLIKFGYPDSVIQSYNHWSVLLRPQQITLGSLILACHGPEQAFSQLPAETMQEFAAIIRDIESNLTRCFSYDKINYLMLMMVDPHVHFHVIPRYQDSREFGSVHYQDVSWPGPPDLAANIGLSKSQSLRLKEHLAEHWLTVNHAN